MEQKISNKKEECNSELLALEKGLLTELKEAVRDLPFVTICAFQQTWSTSNAIISYERLSSDFNKCRPAKWWRWRPQYLDWVFTCLTAGHYTVSYTALASLKSGEQIYIHLYLN